MDSLVPSLKEIPSPIPILVFQGRTDISRELSGDSMQRDASAHRVGFEIPLVKVMPGPEVWGVKYHLLRQGVLESERRLF
jgi:hypothetical protein